MRMAESGTKKKILKVVEQLPDDATIEAAAKAGKWDRDALERAFERRPA